MNDPILILLTWANNPTRAIFLGYVLGIIMTELIMSFPNPWWKRIIIYVGLIGIMSLITASTQR